MIDNPHAAILATKGRKGFQVQFGSAIVILRTVRLLFLYSLVTTKADGASSLSCENPTYDFGTAIGQEEIVHEYILKNRGDKPIVISNIKNCCGTQSTVIPMEILPGSNAVCKTVFSTRNRYGPQEKQILIASNDREHPYFELRMIGTLLKAIEVSPRYIRLGDLLPDSTISQTIVATNLLEDTAVLESVRSTIPGIRAAVIVSGERAWTIGLSIEESPAVGKLNGKIELNFSTGTTSIPVSGTVKPMIQSIPDQIIFAKGSDQPVERLVMLRSETPFVISNAVLEHAEGSIAKEQLDDGKWRIILRVIPSSIAKNARLMLDTSDVSQPSIHIPLLIRHE